ncbi:glycosyltransferase family 2 protein [Psychroflexus sediminis]|uniref:Glycosyltransferase involved in cell wall bisynthesis n=1 Tax=Psychroflexus sediminis TaxID=470826 RepID=A0A1G7UKD5_9FLAO|nr:glycosyltransferase family 2 protein [Psychroflexus sediminis]SDG47701.1 Glycosyltransferase involved in cell wall bisynthesis [Psychroflexus sediminis]
MSDLVSIITPVYNAEKYIKETLTSVRNQTHEHWEHILVDDGSSDQSLKRIEEFSKTEPRIRLIKLPENSGPAVARNKAISLAKGRYLAFLDADDIWFDFHLKDSLKVMKTKDYAFVFASYKRSDEDLNFVYPDFEVPSKVSYTDILKSNSISCLTAVVDIHKLGKKEMPLIRKRQDMGLWLKYLKETQYAHGIKQPHAIYRIRENSLSRNKFNLIKYQWEFYRKVENINALRSLYYITLWTYLGYKKYKK